MPKYFLPSWETSSDLCGCTLTFHFPGTMLHNFVPKFHTNYLE